MRQGRCSNYKLKAALCSYSIPWKTHQYDQNAAADNQHTHILKETVSTITTERATKSYRGELQLWTKTRGDSLGLLVIADQVTYMV